MNREQRNFRKNLKSRRRRKNFETNRNRIRQELKELKNGKRKAFGTRLKKKVINNPLD